MIPVFSIAKITETQSDRNQSLIDTIFLEMQNPISSLSLNDAYALWGIDADNEWEAVGGFRRKPLYVNGVKLGYTNADEGWELLLLLGKYLGEATYGKLPDTSNMSASVWFIWNRLHTGDNEPIRYKLIGRAKRSPEIKRLTEYLKNLRG